MKTLIIITLFLLQVLCYAEDTTTECPKGTILNSQTNRCTYTASSMEQREDFTKCDGIDDATEKSNCLESAAIKKAKKTESEFYDDVTASELDKNNSKAKAISGITSAFSTLSIYQMFFAKNNTGFKGASLSSKIFTGTSVAGFIKNTFFEKDVKEKTGKMMDKFKEEVSDVEGMKDAQVRAFDFLEEEQSFLRSHAKKQKNFYNMMAMGYIGAMGTAVYEMVTAKGGTSCMKNAGDSIAAKVSCPPILIPIAATASALSYRLAQAAGDQADQAKENIEKIQEIRAGFMKSIENFCPDVREDMSNPTCFCYDLDGSKNNNRTNSQTCQSHWNRYQNLWVEPNVASNVFDPTEVTGCQYLDGKFDSACNCRRVIDATGQNACLKVMVPPQAANALAGINTSPALSGVNQILSGNQSPSAFSTVSGTNAATADQKRDLILKKIDKQLKKNGIKNPNQVADYVKREMKKSVKNKAPYSFMANNAAKKPGRLLPPTAQKLIDDTKAKGIKELNVVAKKSKARGRSKSKKKKNNWFDLDSDLGQGQEVVKFDGTDTGTKKYKYKDNDIIKDRGVSIWKVLSNRYNNSGLRRLFDE